MNFALISTLSFTLSLVTRSQAILNEAVAAGILLDIRGAKTNAASRQRQIISTPSFASSVDNFIGLHASTSTTSLVDSAATDASDTSSSALRGSSSSKTAKEAVCDGLRVGAHDAIMEETGIDVSDEFLDEHCLSFSPSDSVPNGSCPFGYNLRDGFSNGNLEFYQLNGYQNPITSLALENLCECIYGFDLGCAATIPRTGDDFAYQGNTQTSTEWTNCCLAAGVWNGDNREEVLPTDQVRTCGCYFISQAQDKVGGCPGVNLGVMGSSPPASPTPTLSPTLSPTLFPSLSPTLFPSLSPTLSPNLDALTLRLNSDAPTLRPDSGGPTSSPSLSSPPTTRGA